LADGRRIAVKRLDKASGQGLKELRNELLLVAKLRHNNLAKLLGVCVKGQEKLLVYEYMPNRSLDTYLFGTQATLPCHPFPSQLCSMEHYIPINNVM
jgi:serine/threonine protein kinase